MAFSPEAFEALWGLRYAAFNPEAIYSLHPVVFFPDNHVPHAESYELGKGHTHRFQELGAFVARAEKVVERSSSEAVLAAVVLTYEVEDMKKFAASILLDPTQRVVLKPESFITWLYGPIGSGTAKHLRWYNRFINPAIAVNRMPEPVGYSDVAGDIAACAPTILAGRHHRPHVAVYTNRPTSFPLVNTLASDSVAMRLRLTYR